MKIYVMRHGLTELNKKKVVNAQIDEPLAPEGVKQAKAIAASIPETVTHIYVSPLLRAKQTAKIINTKKLPTSEQKELAEIHMGSLAGKAWDEMEFGSELKQKHRGIQFDYRQHGGESASDVKKRIVKFLQSINDKHKDNEVLIVTHGGIIRTLHLLQNGIPQVEEIENLALLEFEIDTILKNFL